MTGTLVKLARDLDAQEARLLVVVIPGRATLYPEQVRFGKYSAPVRAHGETETLAAFSKAGVEILDMTEPLWEFRERTQAFFATDGHWTPEAMKAVAVAVNKRVRQLFPRLASTETPVINASIRAQLDVGDLARRLAPRTPERWLGVESAELVSIRGIGPDAGSPIVLHGGALLRVFDDPRLSFGGDDESPRAGFATQLATLLGRPLDVRGMPSPEEDHTGKKLVICLLPMADQAP